jgi:hypothetical protein
VRALVRREQQDRPVLLMIGLTLAPAPAASLLLNMEGALTAMLAWFVFKENFDRRMGACLCWAIGNNLTRKVSARVLSIQQRELQFNAIPCELDRHWTFQRHCDIAGTVGRITASKYPYIAQRIFQLFGER